MSTVAILGIDPGSKTTGFALLTFHHRRLTEALTGVWSPPRKLPTWQRLKEVAQSLETLILQGKPTHFVLEKIFLGPHVASSLILAQVRGALLLKGVETIPLFYEYSAKTVKKVLTGSGSASKRTLLTLLKAQFPTLTREDESDAIAIALCHAVEFHQFPILEAVHAKFLTH